jgi:lysophospholipase L1-like esterase
MPSVIELALRSDWPACVSAAVSRPSEAATAGGPYANTALHLAAQPAYGASAAVIAALAAAWPAAALSRNSLGNTPLHAAAKWGASCDILTALLTAPGSSAAAFMPGEDGALPLELALRRGGVDSQAAVKVLRTALLALVAPQPAVKAARAVPPHMTASVSQLFSQLMRPPAGDCCLCFAGSSILAYWPLAHATASFAQLDVQLVNVAVPGSEAQHLAALMPPLLQRLQPRVLLVYAGGNDVANGASGATVGAAMRAFLLAVRAAAPCTRVVLLGIMLAPSKFTTPALAAATLAACEALRAVAAAEGALFVDLNVRGAFLTPDTCTPRRELFVDDGLHLNVAGYDTIRDLVVSFVTDAWRSDRRAAAA